MKLVLEKLLAVLQIKAPTDLHQPSGQPPPPPHQAMDSSSLAIYLSALVGLFLLAISLTFRPGRKLNLPPGPKPWPIIGNLNHLSSLPHRDVHRLALKYGPIMQIYFGSHPVVVASTVETAKLFLKAHDLSFASRPKTASGKHTTYNNSDITWSPYGPYWRQARKICVMELFSPKRLDSHEHIRVEEVQDFLKILFRQSGKTICLKDYLGTLSLNIISRMVLGKTYTAGSGGAGEKAIVSSEEFEKMVEELFLLNGVLNIGDSIPWLDFLDLQGYIKRMKVLAKKFDRFLEHVTDEHSERRQQEGPNFVAKDMVDVLLEFADDPSQEVKIGRIGVKAFTQDMLAGGTESSTVTVEWAIAEMLNRPETFKKATEELDRVIGKDRWVEEKDMAQLPYLEAIVKEVMRLHAVAPMLAPRMAREDINIMGYDIPAGTRALVSVWTIARDPSLWESPEVFMPERFIGSQLDVKGNHYELLPFGAGRRMCPGYNLGLKVVQLTLANLLLGFTWRLPDGMKKEELSLQEIFGLSTPKQDPLDVVVEPRLPAHLYGV